VPPILSAATIGQDQLRVRRDAHLDGTTSLENAQCKRPSARSLRSAANQNMTACAIGRHLALDNPASVGSRQYTRVLALAGGLPIKVGDEVVGAVGVSGSPGKDDVCSQAGIDKVADQLK
jgi:uncharacterized protein GlcG (DUF336 family)